MKTAILFEGREILAEVTCERIWIKVDGVEYERCQHATSGVGKRPRPTWHMLSHLEKYPDITFLGRLANAIIKKERSGKVFIGRSGWEVRQN
ncbi:hypothetical protein HYV31_03175 [candidate division WWE3 bacterium]|nr:hypothetical protein [candidate division WWE3 bacterium]